MGQLVLQQLAHVTPGLVARPLPPASAAVPQYLELAGPHRCPGRSLGSPRVRVESGLCALYPPPLALAVARCALAVTVHVVVLPLHAGQKKRFSRWWAFCPEAPSRGEPLSCFADPALVRRAGLRRGWPSCALAETVPEGPDSLLGLGPPCHQGCCEWLPAPDPPPLSDTSFFAVDVHPNLFLFLWRGTPEPGNLEPCGSCTFSSCIPFEVPFFLLQRPAPSHEPYSPLVVQVPCSVRQAISEDDVSSLD